MSPLEDSLKNGPKHVGIGFKVFNVNLLYFKVYIIIACFGILKK
jgi:hypothetical protein